MLRRGGRGWIRTTEAERRQIYSLFHLTALELSRIQFVSRDEQEMELVDGLEPPTC